MFVIASMSAVSAAANYCKSIMINARIISMYTTNSWFLARNTVEAVALRWKLCNNIWFILLEIMPVLRYKRNNYSTLIVTIKQLDCTLVYNSVFVQLMMSLIVCFFRVNDCYSVRIHVGKKLLVLTLVWKIHSDHKIDLCG